MSGRGRGGGGRTGQRGGQTPRGRGRAGGVPQQNSHRYSRESHLDYRHDGDPQQHQYRNAGDQQQHLPPDDGSCGRGIVNSNPNPPQSFSASSSSFSYASVTKRSAVRVEPSSSASSLAVSLEQRLKLEEEEEHKTSQQQKQQATASSSIAIVPPDRPGFGQIGRPCRVRANHFLIQLSGNCDFHHYDISINPELTSKKTNRAVIMKLVDLYKKSHLGNRLPVYDGMKSLYTAGPLPFDSSEFQINLDDGPERQKNAQRRERKFKVTIKIAGRLDIHDLPGDAPQEMFQALEVVLRESSSQKYNVKGRSFFDPCFGKPEPMDGGLECWRGFHQSVRPTQGGFSLNIDLKATVFFQPILVIDHVTQLLNKDSSRPLSDRDRVKIKKALKGVQVQGDYGVPRQYRVTGLSAVPTSQLMFPVEDRPEMMSVVQYYKEKYNITLKHANWPALQAGNDKQPKYLPMEVFKIVSGQRYIKKLNEKQMKDMLRATCKCPADRENLILQIVETLDYNNDKYAKEFGIQVCYQFACVKARLLPTPTLKYQSGVCTPDVGSWNMTHKRVVNGATIDHWACLNFSPLYTDAKRFCDELARTCNAIGMNFRQAPVFAHVTVRDTDPDMILKRLHTNAMSNFGKGLDLLIVILPENSTIHGRLKKICETELGIISVCCVSKKIIKFSSRFLENMALKINVKAGGRNTVLNDFMTNAIPGVTDKSTIIFGADVTHPQPGDESSPSIAAVVASQDWPEIARFRCSLSTQERRKEIIQDLYKEENDPKGGLMRGGMIQELLRSFANSTGKLPSRIIFYRDGVSEGQFNQVLQEELLAIQKACASVRDGYSPTITFVVVQKRHHTRLVPFDHTDNRWKDRSGNILAGTVVDTGICHPSQFDFYLCSHSGIQGTSRPTHYHVLWDENKFTADSFQKLTYNLCYTNVRCTRSVSMVPAAHYAHLAAFRARSYLEETSESGSTVGSAGHGSSVVQPLPQIKENLKNKMFYI